MVYKRNNDVSFEKYGVRMTVYNAREDFPHAAIAYQETETGHAEEFVHEKSAFVYYILEGEGTWVIDGREYPVKATDVIMVPPGHRIYFRGNLKQLCVTVPAWEERYERHVRFIEDL